jgi:arylsulfatase A-like enzyme
MGVLDEMIVIILADHGTGLGEHGRFGGFLPYEEQIRIPILMRIPGIAPRWIDDRVASIDVAPTLLGLVAPGRLNPYHGRSLLPLMTGARMRLGPRPTVSFCAFADGYALTDGDGRYKLWHNRGDAYEALFDLREDPEERRNLVDREPEIAKRLRDLLAAFLWQGRQSYANPYHYRDWDGIE